MEEEGDRARRDPDTDVGETWGSTSLTDLERPHAGTRQFVLGWEGGGKVSDSCGGHRPGLRFQVDRRLRSPNLVGGQEG